MCRDVEPSVSPETHSHSFVLPENSFLRTVMPTTTFSRRFATLLSTGLLLLTHSANAAALHPKALPVPARYGSLLLPRQQPCEKATLGVSEDRVILCLLSANACYYADKISRSSKIPAVQIHRTIIHNAMISCRFFQ